MKAFSVVQVLFSISCIVIVSALFFVRCSSSDEPEPFDCDDSDLAIQVLPAGILNPSGCNNTGSITASVTGGSAPFTYSLNSSSTFQASATFSSLGPGSYSVTVKDGNGCTKTFSNILLTAPGSPVPETPVIASDTECTSDNGSITINATGGIGTLSYSKDGINFQVSNVFSDLHAGNYTFTVKDEGNCIVVVNASVPNETGVDYDNDILPIFQSICQHEGCHPANGNWFDYNTAKNKSSEIKRRITLPDGDAQKMPASGSLTSDQIATIVCWVDHGAPKN